MREEGKMPPEAQRIQVELPEKESEGIYSNLALITHSPSEFVLDFARLLPGSPKAKIFARIVMTPMHTRSLLDTLEKNIKLFEDKFGKIKVSGTPDNKEIGF
jgi:hypothetical protein